MKILQKTTDFGVVFRQTFAFYPLFLPEMLCFMMLMGMTETKITEQNIEKNDTNNTLLHHMVMILQCDPGD